jgi:phosphoglycerate dehydrogenase-like enzyme
MKKKAVITCSSMLDEGTINELRELYDLESAICTLGEDDLISGLKYEDILIMGGAEYITEQIDSAYPKLTYLFIGIEARTSFDPSVWEKVVSEKRVFATGGGQEAVAQKTFKEISIYNPLRQQSNISRHLKPVPSAEEMLKDQDLLVIGAGNIGQRVMQKSKGIFRKIIYAGGRGEKKVLSEQGFIYIPAIENAVLSAHVITTHLEFIPEVTEGIIKREDLLFIPKNGIFVNNARSGLMNSLDLYMFLIDRPDVLVIFDHFFKEGKDFLELKKDPDGILSRILRRSNFIYTGHTAVMSPMTRKEYGENLFELIKKNDLV